MIVYGYVKGYKYAGDGTLQIQVRIPNVHGAYKIADYSYHITTNYNLFSTNTVGKLSTQYYNWKLEYCQYHIYSCNGCSTVTKLILENQCHDGPNKRSHACYYASKK